MKKSFLFLALLYTHYLPAQQAGNYYRLPIDGQLSLSANYGELRSNHFHAGIDIRVGGVVGAPIYAVADGYVSRISVSPTGYGKAVYITHPNGTTSVYGHLHNFSPNIKAYIENIQYARQRFAMDITVDEGLLLVKQGGKIGAAGNSGSSGGPHLHFEIRDTPLQIPADVFAKGYYKVPTDNLPPTIRKVSFFSFRQIDSIPFSVLFHQQAKQKGKVNQAINVSDTFYIGIDVYDSQNGTLAKLAVNRLSVTIDNEPIFGCVYDDIPFDLSLCINSAIAYKERVCDGQVLLKTYIEPGNKLNIYRDLKKNGLITLPDTLPHTLKIKAVDDAGNTTTNSFIVQKRTNVPIAQNPYIGTKWILAHWNRENTIVQNGGLQVTIPSGALYQSTPLVIDTLAQRPAKSYSPLWHIHTSETPLHRAMIINMEAKLPDSLKSKALLAGINSKGVIYSAGGGWQNNAVETSSRGFGDFFVTIDTVSPVIKPAFSSGANLSQQSQLSVKITDNFSGIATYNAYIDGEWALFEYDAKNHALIYIFDAKRITRNKKHKLLLTVTDNKQNTGSLQTYFTW